MSLYRKEGSPFWYADIRVPGKPRVRVSTKETTKGAARTAETEFIQKLSSGLSTRRQKSPALRDYAKDFLAHIEKTRLADKTKEGYRYGWSLLQARAIAGVRVDAITTSDTQAIGIPGSGSTVNCALRTLRRMLNLAAEKDMIVKVPKIHLVEENQRERLVESSEEAVILAKAPKTLRDAYLLIADCGMRPAETAVLNFENVDFVRNEILVVRGKTGKKSRRHLTMSSRVREMLIERARHSDTWVFPSKKGKRTGLSITPHSISSRFSTFKKAAGFADSLVLYSARHTFATDLTEATGNLGKTQKALGHTSLKTTQRYVHTDSADIGTIMDERNAKRLEFGPKVGHSTDAVQ